MASESATGTEAAQLMDAPREWWSAALEVSAKRREFDRTGQPDDWFPLFQRVEAEFPVGLVSRERSSEIDSGRV